MSRAPVVRAVITFLILAGSLAVALTIPARLGLDLRGGVQLVLEAQSTDQVTANAESTDRAIDVLSNRVDALGVAEPSLTRSGENRIIVELPGEDDPQEAVEVVGQTAQLTFHPVLGYAEPEAGRGQGQPTPGEAGDGVGDGAGDGAGEGADQGNGGQPDGATEGAGDGGDNGAGAGGDDEQNQSLGEPRTAPRAAPAAADPDDPAGTASPEDAGGETSPEAPAPTEGNQPQDTDSALVLPDEDGVPLELGPAALDGERVTDAAGEYDPTQGAQWFVSIDFDGRGGRAWQGLTADAACSAPGEPGRRVAIVLDDKIISSPQVVPDVQCDVGMAGGSTQITGNFSPEEAKDLAALIKGGALPLPVEVIEQRVIGPTLGAEAIEASFLAGVIGLILTGLFIISIYRLMGLLATIALAIYALISYAALVAIGATLTLPGLAGFVLAVGMAIDANVLIFERAREEYAARSSLGLRPALVRGARGAWSAIIDSNVTTLLAAGLLFFLASGPVQGFGVTLSLGVIASMFSALVVARVFTEWAAGRQFMIRHPKLSGLSHIGRIREWVTEKNPDLMSRGRLWLAISGLIVAVSLAGILVRGLNFGIEFTGGRLVEYATSQEVPVEEARAAIADAGFPRAVVQESGAGDASNLSVRTTELTNAEENEIRAAIADLGVEVTQVRDELIGPSLGEELRNKALIALAIALVAQMLYLMIRFRWTFGVAALLAMFHDVIAVIGLFAWLGKPIDGVFLAAILSVIGLSVNDTIVVFDRVRELWAAEPKRPFAQSSNLAILQTVPRTVNTGLGAMFILAALTVLGGDSLTDFALALLAGLGIGLLSSVFTATPLTIEFQSRARPVAPPSAGRKDKSTAKQRARQAGSGAVV